MNTGLVASRYALAFLRYVEIAGTGELVINQVQVLLSFLYEEKEIALALESNSVSLQQKKEMLKTLVYPQPLSDELYRLIVLLLNSSKTFKLEPSLTFNISSFFKTGFCFFTSSLGFSTFPLLQAKTKLSKNINVTNFFILFSLLLSFNFKTPFKSVIFCLIIRLNLHFHIFNFTHSQRLY